MLKTAGITIIGNEILSGRTQDANLSYLAKSLADMGIHLQEARVISDDLSHIVDTVNEYRRRYDYVFTTGGIGATHDDRTAEAVAQAFERPLQEHPVALACLQEYYGDRLNEARRRMALMPADPITLIDNHISKAPGFQIDNVFVLAGVPSIAQAMFDTVRNRLVGGPPIQYRTINCALPEGNIADALRALQGRFHDIDIGSYPYFKDGVLGTNLVIRGIDSDRLQEAEIHIQDMITNLNSVIK